MGDVKGDLISVKMKLEHGKMIKLLDDFVKGKKGAFELLRDSQSKHASAEEQAIMIFYEGKKDFKLLKDILEQHETLRGYLSTMNTDPSAAKKYEKLMREHIALEDKKFYPMLDKDLTPAEQKKIFENFLYLFGQKIKAV
jgi:hemerythrin-like domain-containing protein